MIFFEPNKAGELLMPIVVSIGIYAMVHANNGKVLNLLENQEGERQARNMGTVNRRWATTD